MTATRRLLAVLALASIAGVARAQSTTISATATVGTGLTVTGLAPLDFGTVFQGVNNVKVNFNNASAGRFRLGGLNNSQMAMIFTLPAVLTKGLNTLPMTDYDIRVNGTNSTPGSNKVNVTSGVPVLARLVSGNLYVFIGGTTSIGTTQSPGIYTGTIVLAAAYTGL